jgi:hypothetical protein
MIKFDLKKDEYSFDKDRNVITINGEYNYNIAKAMDDMRCNPKAEVKGFVETKLFTLKPESMYFDLLESNMSVTDPYFDGDDITNRVYYLTNGNMTLRVFV